MPYVNVRILDDDVTAEQKRGVIAGITSVLVGVLGKDPASCTVVIDEVPLDNWGINGESVAVRRRQESRS
jgi:4-oxalocrotonate tautomerase